MSEEESWNFSALLPTPTTEIHTFYSILADNLWSWCLIWSDFLKKFPKKSSILGQSFENYKQNLKWIGIVTLFWLKIENFWNLLTTKKSFCGKTLRFSNFCFSSVLSFQDPHLLQMEPHELLGHKMIDLTNFIKWQKH